MRSPGLGDSNFVSSKFRCYIQNESNVSFILSHNRKFVVIISTSTNVLQTSLDYDSKLSMDFERFTNGMTALAYIYFLEERRLAAARRVEERRRRDERFLPPFLGAARLAARRDDRRLGAILR